MSPDSAEKMRLGQNKRWTNVSSQISISLVFQTISPVGRQIDGDHPKVLQIKV